MSVTGRSEVPFWRDERVIKATAQVVSAVIVIGGVIWTIANLIEAADRRGLSLGFEFISEPAGFPISEAIIPYDPSKPFLTAFLVGILNTIKASLVGIVLATILGTLVGLARLSGNWLLSRIALVYIELHRNVPLLVLLFIWYFAFFNNLPGVKESLRLPGPIYLNQRGLYLVWGRLTSSGRIWMISLVVGLLCAALVWVVLRRRQVAKGQRTHFGAAGLGVFLVIAASGWFLAGGHPLELDVPFLDGFNYQGGLRLTREFAAILVGLVSYTAAFIAEVVRAGIQAVDRGQLDAARAVGLSNLQILSLVIIPQALRVIIPPLISQYLNLTKNSSLGVAIGFADLFNVGRIMINQAGRAVPVFALIMVSYLTMSLLTSVILNVYNRRIQLVQR